MAIKVDKILNKIREFDSVAGPAGAGITDITDNGDGTLTITYGSTGDTVVTGNLQGLPGDDGREIELQTSATHIQRRYVGDASRTNLVLLSDLNGISFTPKGEYSSGTAYVPNDVVSYLGSSWIALQNTTGNTPSEGAYWTLNAAKGADGEGAGDISGSGTANELAYFTAEKTIDNLPVATYPSLTELSYVKGLTRSAQNQIDGKNSYHGVVARPVGASNPLPTTITTTTFTLGATANPISYYYMGTLVNVTSNKTATLNDGTAGLYYVYFDGATGNILATKNNPGTDATSNVIIATVFWNGTDLGLVSDERHSYNRNKARHTWAHNTVGCRYRSGLTLTNNGGTGAAATFALTAGEIADEDIQFAIDARTDARVFYQTSANDYTFVSALTTIPFYAGANNRPNYVRSDTYAVVQMTSANNRFINVFVYATTDLGCPLSFVTETVSATVAANNGYNSANAARAIPFPNLSGLGTRQEIKPIYRLIARADGQIQAIDTVSDDYRLVSSLPMGAGNTSTTAAAVTFNPYDGISAGNVQAAIEELADEKLDKSTFDANTIIKADTDNTPAALTVGEQTLVGRKTGGVITALTPTEVRTMINVADGAIANPMTTAGDIIYGGTSGVATRLAKGTAGQVLKMNSGATAPEWGTASGGVEPIRIRIPGELVADANYHQGIFWRNTTGSTITISNVKIKVATAAAGTGAAAAFNIYKSSGTDSNGINTSATALFSSAIDLTTNYSDDTNTPDTATVEDGRWISLRCTASAGATNKASDVEVIIIYS